MCDLRLENLYGSKHQARDTPIHGDEAALLIIDVQESCAKPHSDKGLLKDTLENNYMFDRLKNTTIPAIQTLLQGFRQEKCKGEVIYTYIESLTLDGRDNSLDYKLSGFHVPKGSPGAKILDEIAPLEDEILIPKTSCSVFCSTNIEYVLRNLGTKELVIVGIKTNQCVESAVRDASDRGFLITVVEEACATDSEQDHLQSLKNMRGFARIKPLSEAMEEIKPK